MEELFRETLSTKQNKIFQPSIKMDNEYPIYGDYELENSKKHLKGYVFGNEPEWKFLPDRIGNKTGPKEPIMYYPPKEGKQDLLRLLRPKYLHRSAKLNNLKTEIAHGPAPNRKRPIIPPR